MRNESWRLFDQIAPRYDLLNRILSLGLDILWRRRLLKFLPPGDNLKVLDIATGTADVPLMLIKKSQKVQLAHGLDMSARMLTIGKRKITRDGLEGRIVLKQGDAAKLPYDQPFFNASTIAFGIRNMPDVFRVLREMSRVLTPGGRILILEFSLPKNFLVRWLYLIYLRFVVPVVGCVFSGHFTAYRYLNKTIETFPSGNSFLELLRSAGFKNLKTNSLLFGIASIYQGDKPSGD